MKNKAVVLLSGGLDSAVTLYSAKAKGFECHCLLFDYGQRHHREMQCAKKIAGAAGVGAQVIKIKLPWKGSALLDKGTRLPAANKKLPVTIPSTYVPGRNIIFLSFALSCAEAIGAKSIFIGAHAQDYSGYPDCRPEFYRAFKLMARCGTKRGAENKPVKIETPLIDKNKAEIIKLGAKLNVPFGLTYSCYRGTKKPCGRCDSCYFRSKGFSEAGLLDPTANS
jgi:7-cyano-7-deazaguanine synthase